MQTILLLGPDLGAVSGVSTHLNQLLGSALARGRRLLHFQVGSEGRRESPLRKAWRFASSPFALLARLLRERPEIVHINSAMEPKAFWRDLVYVGVARACGAKVVFQVHGGFLPREFAGANPVKRALLKAVLRRSHAVVLLAEVERAAYGAFLPGLPLSVVANAIDADELLRSERTDARGGAPLRLAYVGRLAAVKGIFEAVEAVRLLRERGVCVELVFAGAGPDEAALRERVAAHGLQDRVRFAGSLFGADKERLWTGTDVFLFPTYHREGLPYALLESMAAGAVPVTCPVGAIPDVMADGVHGVFVPPRDPAQLATAVERLHTDRAHLEALSCAGRRRIREGYTVQRLASDFDALYRSL